MKILVISDEVWNDTINGNNVLSNWFNGFNAEFANIYASPGLPENNCCKKYFQLTDSMMVNSILKGIKAGRILSLNDRYTFSNAPYNSTDVNGIGFLRKYFGNILRLLKTIVWRWGKYDTEALKSFITEFNPDIIFSPRFAHSKILRIENEVLKYVNCPIVAFTGDNEYSLRRFELSPVFWGSLFYQRKVLKNMMPKYSLYYTLSKEQKEEYEKQFNVNMKVLMKCGDFSEVYTEKNINTPIRMVYAGKLYLKRWKTLAKIGVCLKEINKHRTKMILDIYTQDNVTKKKNKLLNDNKNIFLKGAVTPDELEEIYKKADIALHVESFSLKHRYSTRVSFSTKIIDCLASSCAVMAITWKEHSGITYLKKEDAAFCVDNLKKLYNVLKEISENTEQIKEYQRKAWKCGKNNHKKEVVQKMLYDDFTKVICEYKKGCTDEGCTG